MTTYSGQRLHQLVLDRTGDSDLARDVAVVAKVLPFKVSSYVVDELIDWGAAPEDPIYRLVFPHRDMLEPSAYAQVAALLGDGDRAGLAAAVAAVRAELNPHPGEQLSQNIPQEDELETWGLQHKYQRTVLVFPKQGQTCHSYCGYCFRWAQFTDQPALRQAVTGPQVLTSYLSRHPEVSDVLMTGGDPLVMRTELLEQYLEPLLQPRFDHIRTIRIGTKALAYWPYRITDGPDADRLIELLSRLVERGKHVAFMAHFSHPRELAPAPAQQAIRRLQSTGAVLRAQGPIVRHVNSDPAAWSAMWTEQVRLGIAPYYMFVERDTGAKRYFGLPLAEAVACYQEALRTVSGLARTARGPVMSATPGKVVIDGVAELDRGPAFALRFLQARDESLVGRPFFARYDADAQWWDELTPYGIADNPFFKTSGKRA